MQSVINSIGMTSPLQTVAMETASLQQHQLQQGALAVQQ